MIEYAIFPQKLINITQRANSSFSHANLQAWDIADIDSKVQQAFAPCTVKVLAKPTSNANTVLFGTCDDLGNPRAVMTENGMRILTFGFTHDDYIGDIEIGRIYKSGKKIYDEGKAGYATGNHIHLEVASGWQFDKITDVYGHYRLRNITSIANIFYQLKGWNEIKNANGYTFTEVNQRFTESENDMSLKIVAIKQKLAIRETMTFTTKKVVDYDPFTNKTVVRTRPSATGKIMHILDIGQSVEIIEPVPGIQRDSWQWFKIRYKGKECFCQYDSMAYSIEKI